MRVHKLLIPIVVLLILGAPATFAKGGFIGVSFGEAETEIQEADNDFDVDESAWKIWGGYDIINPFGIEVGYADLGSYSVTVGNNINTDQYRGEASALYAAGVGQITFVKIVTIFGKVGIAGYKEEQIKNDGPPFHDETSTVAFYGAGIGFEVLKVQIRLEYEVYDTGQSEGAEQSRLATIGARWNF